MKYFLSLLLVCAVAVAQDTAEPEAESTESSWRLTLDLQQLDVDYQPVIPFTLLAGESVTTGGDLDGSTVGFTLSVDRNDGSFISGFEIAVARGDIDGEATYSGTYLGSTDVEADITSLSLRARHSLCTSAYAFLGLTHQTADTDEQGTVIYDPTGIALAVPINRQTDSRTTLIQPGIGVRLESPWDSATIGILAEATLNLGTVSIDTTSGGPSPDDGSLTGYHLLLAVYTTLPITDSWHLYAQTGLAHQDWFSDPDELQETTSWHAKIGIQHSF